MIKNQKRKTGAPVRMTQTLMNRFGFTDRMGNTLREDGVLGVKTRDALGKFKRYQSELAQPSNQTKTLQKQLNRTGHTYLDGKPLKEDGVFGPKTDYVQNAADNAFTGRLMDADYKDRTLARTTFPKMAKLDNADVEKLTNGQWPDFKGQARSAARQKSIARTGNSAYPMANRSNARFLNEAIAQPTQMPKETPAASAPDWRTQWNATPQYEQSGVSDWEKPGNAGRTPKKQQTLDDLFAMSDEELTKLGIDKSQLENARVQQGMYDVEKDHYRETEKETREWLLKNDLEAKLAPYVEEGRKIAQKYIAQNGTPNGSAIQRMPSDEDAIKWSEQVSSWKGMANQFAKDPLTKGIAEKLAPKNATVFENETQAAKAFGELAKENVDWNKKEFASMMVTMKVPQKDADGNTTMTEKTMLFPVMQGGEKNVVIPILSQYAAINGAQNLLKPFGINLPVTSVSFIHSHPKDGSGIIDEFSNGDRAVAFAPGVSNIYRVDGDDDDIWRYNELEEQMYPDPGEKEEGAWPRSKGHLYNGLPIYPGIRIK